MPWGTPWATKLMTFEHQQIQAMATKVESDREAKTVEGKVVSTAEGKLVMSDGKGGNQQTFMVPPAAIITLDGKTAQLNELMKGDSVKVMTGVEGNVTAVAGQRAKS